MENSKNQIIEEVISVIEGMLIDLEQSYGSQYFEQDIQPIILTVIAELRIRMNVPKAPL